MGEGEDADGIKGVFLRKNVVETCEAALRMNLAALLPRLMPWHVQVICRLNVCRRLWGVILAWGGDF